MSSRTKVLYIGITSNLELRVQQHKQNQHDGFTKEYPSRHSHSWRVAHSSPLLA
jgi:predicted GIY-YIG superfamily endonuclease